MRDDTLVTVENLYMYFPVTAGVLQTKVADVNAVDGVSFYIKRGKTLGLVLYTTRIEEGKCTECGVYVSE